MDASPTRKFGFTGLVAGCVLLANAAAIAATILVPTDQPTIADAIDVAVPGDVIQIAVGTYTERLEVPRGLDNLTIQGEPASGSVIEAPGTGDNILRIRSNGVLVQDLTLVGGNTAIRLDYSTGSTLQFLTMEHPREGIRVTNGQDNSISDVVVNGTTGGAGIKVSNSPRISIVGATLFAPRRDGIRVQNAAGANVHGCAVDNAAGGDGIRLSRVEGGEAVLNFVEGSYRDGIRIQNSPGILVEVNESDFNRNYGLRVERCPPIATATDLENAGNSANENGSGNFRVIP